MSFFFPKLPLPEILCVFSQGVVMIITENNTLKISLSSIGNVLQFSVYEFEVCLSLCMVCMA